MSIDFPDINPIILSVGPLAVSWYSLSYVVGIIIFYIYGKYLIKNLKLHYINNLNLDRLINWIIIGLIIGGRLGYVFFYDFMKYLENPIDILKTYEGGMSFHGVLLGIALAVYIYCKKYRVKYFALTDLFAIIAPIGLFLIRIGNFINGELYGRITNLPWAVLFPAGGYLPRHPSQIYEALTGGLLLFFIIRYAVSKKKFMQIGFLSGVFLLGYGCCRFLVEFTREPDSQIGFIISFFTIGQFLSIPMVLLGIFIIKNSLREKYNN